MSQIWHKYFFLVRLRDLVLASMSSSSLAVTVALAPSLASASNCMALGIGGFTVAAIAVDAFAVVAIACRPLVTTDFATPLPILSVAAAVATSSSMFTATTVCSVLKLRLLRVLQRLLRASLLLLMCPFNLDFWLAVCLPATRDLAFGVVVGGIFDAAAIVVVNRFNGLAAFKAFAFAVFIWLAAEVTVFEVEEEVVEQEGFTDLEVFLSG